MAKWSLSLLLFAALISASCQSQSTKKADDQKPQDSGLFDHMQGLLDSASKRVDEVTPSKQRVKELTTDELQKLHTWEYQVLELPAKTESPELEARLNQLGKEMWECAALDKSEKSLRLMCKRRPQTYLRYIPRVF